MRWKAHGPRILSTRVAVVLQYFSREPPPHMTSQQLLVRSLLASVVLAQRVGNDCGPYVSPNIYPGLSTSGPLHPPHTTWHGNPCVLRMVPHRMEHFATLKPLLHCFHFSWRDNRVKVTRYEDVHLRVKGREEAPDHGEHVDRVVKEGMG